MESIPKINPGRSPLSIVTDNFAELTTSTGSMTRVEELRFEELGTSRMISPRAQRKLFSNDEMVVDNKENNGSETLWKPSLFTTSCPQMPSSMVLRRTKSDFGSARKRTNEFEESIQRKNLKNFEGNHVTQIFPKRTPTQDLPLPSIHITNPFESDSLFPQPNEEDVFPKRRSMIDDLQRNHEFSPESEDVVPKRRSMIDDLKAETAPFEPIIFTPESTKKNRPHNGPLSPYPVTPLTAQTKRKNSVKARVRKSVSVNGWNLDAYNSSSCPNSPVPTRASASLPPKPAMNSNDPILPVDSHNAEGIPFINPQTLTDLLSGRYTKNYQIIDCRFEYEYGGGHILNAINIKSECDLEERYLRNPMDDIVLVFHCEFSSVRAPRLASHLRKRDREFHHDSYPQLFYPQLFLLKGGYKNYFEHFPQHCDGSYVQMKDPEFKDQLKQNADLVHSSRSKVKRSYSTGAIDSITKWNLFQKSPFEFKPIVIEKKEEEATTRTTPTLSHREINSQ
eukprot:TRINITY_DN9836_c0_g1_i1.p1 TRINITY_DN9836_c0_g1~~TRINITY_DN9836_c0_g1_i1.p1  ORF type:complete len:507 (+),score=128.41 TRINITY_DN9836_c0_g1_i1:129-1649(+)